MIFLHPRNLFRRGALTCIVALSFFGFSELLRAGDLLREGFERPPENARPQTWWHWMNGNVTREGITADLEAMKQIGLGGAQIFNADCDIPAGPVRFDSPEWHALFTHAVREADRLGLQLCIHNCAGWSSSGGPWITPEEAMQHVVTSEMRIHGPAMVAELLPAPAITLGYYRDIAVLAFPATAKGGREPRISIENLAAKTGESGSEVLASQTSKLSDAEAIKPAEMVDVTSHVRPDGHLNWSVPAGDWTILRVGYTPTGVENHPAPTEGTGLECDKFNPAALDAHWAAYVQKALADAGPLAGKVFNNVLIDSYEVGGQNWSANFRREFRHRRGYDPIVYLPVFTGRVVSSPEVSERFLWDLRRTIADLFAEKYYGHFAELCHRYHCYASIEPYTGPFESLQAGKAADLVMGEFWSGSSGDPSVRLAASVAHIYGRAIVGAESFTASPESGRWQNDPWSLKTLGDAMWCTGLNRFIFHRYAMQPWTNRWPGMTMGQWGFHFDRTETWWQQGKAWIDYVSRSQFLLQQGSYVADVAYFCGESAPVELRVGNPPLPPGYQFDAINEDVLLHSSEMRHGRLVLSGGASYRVLVLPSEDPNLSPELLRRLLSFVRSGLTIVGPRPAHSPSLRDYPHCDAEVNALAAKLWGACDGTSVTENTYGHGRVVWGQSLENVLSKDGVLPDFTFSSASAEAKLEYCHRSLPDTDIYFVSNQNRKYETADCKFRIQGRVPELWHSDTGLIEDAPVWHAEGNRVTTVHLNLDPGGSVFVIFRAPADHANPIASVHREGPRMMAAKVRKPDLTILHADYGVFPSDEKQLMDVTGQVRALASAGRRSIPASNDMAGDDPAPNEVKELRVNLNLDGHPLTLTARENQKLQVPEQAEVVLAQYGLFPEATNGKPTTVDLTSKLTSLVHDGVLNIRVDDSLASDPVVNRTKKLELDYALDGVKRHVLLPEGTTLRLPPDQELGEPPAFEIASNSCLKAWAPGRFTLVHSRGPASELEVPNVLPPLEVNGPWTLDFPPNWGAPPRVQADHLFSWPDHSDPGVRYFSGTATYAKELEIPADYLGNEREVWLDLGVVKNFAEVILNGQSLGVMWKPPFRINLTGAARSGTNHLQIKVTNLWPNRLIGDEQLPADREWVGKKLKEWPAWLLRGEPSPSGRYTFTTWHHWSAKDTPLDSGLLGPVYLLSAEVVPLPK